jgi:hypothetical protein
MKTKPIPFHTEEVRAILDGRKTQTRRVVKNRICGLLNPQVVPKKAGDILWRYDWDSEKGIWDRREIIIQQSCFCFEGEIERYIDPYNFTKGTKLFPWQSSPHSCPYGQVGDRLWVRETWADIGYAMFEKPYFVYRATDPEWAKNDGWRGWKPSIHMKREASRITLEITGVRVEKLQDISEEDAIAEGVKCEVYDQGKPISACWYNYQEDLFDGSFNSPEAVDSFRTLWDSINAKHSWESNPWVWVVEFSNLAIAVKEDSQ